MDGIINVYKESGYTSHDVVAKLRGILKQKKIGHTGTLDPEAQGVLPVCLGKATKVCELLTDQKKTYQAVLLLGTATDTQDLTGNILEQKPVTCTEQEVRACIAGFVGVQEQIPPMYSALRVNGRRLYELARQGIEVERRPRTVTIESIETEQIKLPEVRITVTCSKGTYIRTLCHDIGEALGCGGCMKSLLRTQVGPFGISESVRLAEIEQARGENRLSDLVKGTDFVFGDLPALVLTEEAERLVRNGNPLPEKLVSACERTEPGDARQKSAAGSSCSHRPEERKSGGPNIWEEKNRGFGPDGRKSGEPNVREEKNRGFGPDGSKSGKTDVWEETIRIYGADGSFLAVYGKKHQAHLYRAVKMFL